MNQSPLYILDFDGVICNSALETGLAGWKAAQQLWTTMPILPPAPLSHEFQRARPVLETGYEAIIIMRLLFLGETADTLLRDFTAHKIAFLAETKLNIEDLKHRFSATRDAWIKAAIDEWLSVNPLFPGVAEKLITLNQNALWYILTTKQERYVSQILNAHGITLPAQHIFGLDRNRPKEDILVSLVHQHPQTPLYFIEDRLPQLLTVKANPLLKDVTLQLTDWGYNTPNDRLAAEQAGIRVISLDQFITP